jgi:hypothetical protein
MPESPDLAKVEVFRTNIYSGKEAGRLTHALLLHFPGFRINYDLEDCDKILRIEGFGIDTALVKSIARELGYLIEELPD